MEVNWITIIVAFVAASPGLIAGLRAWRRDRIDIAKVSSDVLAAVIDELKEEREAQKAEIKELRQEVAALRAEKSAWGDWQAEQSKLETTLRVETEIRKMLEKKVEEQQKQIKNLTQKVKELEKRDTGPL